MEPLPPIRSFCIKGECKSESSPAVPDVHKVLPLSLNCAQTTPLTKEMTARNNLRREACLRVQQIVCGVTERSTYKEVLGHIEDRFAHFSYEELRPLVSPSHLPSIARPREPQTVTFMRGATLLHTPNREGDSGAVYPAAAEAGDFAYVGFDSHSISAEVGTGASSQLPCSSTGFTEGHKWEILDLASRVFFRRAMEYDQLSSGGPAVPSDAAARSELPRPAAPLPLDELPTWEERYDYFCKVERAGRDYILAYESWDQQVIVEMMAVHFVTFVLKPSMDILRREESAQRHTIVQEEDRVSYFMYNDSALALQVQEGKKAIKARELQLHRILQIRPAAEKQRRGLLPPVSPETFAKSPSTVPAFPAAETPGLAATPPPHSGAPCEDKISSSSANTHENSRLTSLPPSGTSVPNDEARRVLRNYVQRRHGASLDAIGTSATTPQNDQVWLKNIIATFPDSSSSVTARQTSVLVLPPISSAQVPRRNTIGIADCVALLNETMRHREQIITLEERSRNDMCHSFQEEMHVVLEWQRRRMHLERLVYWRHQRELVVKEEVRVLTSITPESQRKAVLLLLKNLEAEECTARQEVMEEERACLNSLRWMTEKLKHVFSVTTLQRSCMNALDLQVWRMEAVARRRLVLKEEASLRSYRQSSYFERLTSLLNGESAGLRLLFVVGRDSTQSKALEVLQKAFRLSLRGRLGWRFTNQMLGREINDSRNLRAIARGTAVFKRFKAAISAEEAQLCEEQRRQHLCERSALFASEAGCRTALMAHQEFVRQSLIRERLLHVEEVFAPFSRGLVNGEGEGRLVLEVEEEMTRDTLFALHTASSEIIRWKDTTMEGEGTGRVSTIREEQASWRQLLETEQDEREVHRINDEEREAEWERARNTLAELAEEDIRRHHEDAMMMCLSRQAETLAGLLSVGVINDPVRFLIKQEEVMSAVTLLDNMATSQCSLYASVLAHRREVELNRVHQQAICVEETEGRANILREEATAWAITEPKLFALLSGPLHDHIVRCRAVMTIITWYRAVRRGDIGRAVSRQKLHEEMTCHREERQLRSQRIAQRLHTQHVRSQLDTLMMEMREEQEKAVQRKLDSLVQCEEPRGRQYIESFEGAVFEDFESIEKSQMAAVICHAKNSDSLVCWQCGGERKGPITSCNCPPEVRLEQRRAEMSDDDFARCIQGAWRASVERSRCKHMLALRRRVAALEAQARAAVELEELEVAATQLWKPALFFFYLDTYVKQSLGRACVGLAVALVGTTELQEWGDRVALLWDMRYEDCDLCLCEEEAYSRRLLEAQFNKPFLLQTELKGEEQHERAMLVQERTLFLLRILLLKEHKQRLVLVSEEYHQRASLHMQLVSATHMGAQEL